MSPKRPDLIDAVRRSEGLRPALEGGFVCVALSGGRDSVALLAALVEVLGAERVLAHHVRHGLRDDVQDAALCARVCEGFGVALSVTVFAPGALEGSQGEGLQDQARRARYEALLAAAKAGGAAFLATAHHRDDAIETSLIRWVRGSGLEGLAGIRPVVQRGALQIIRPLLEVERAQIDAFVRAQSLPWVEDPSNATDHYMRNRIRHRVLPALARERGLGGLGQTLANLRDDAKALDWFADQAVEQFGHLTQEPAWYGRLARLEPGGAAVMGQVLRHAARRVLAGYVPSAQAVRAVTGRALAPGRGLWRDGHLEMGREGAWLVVRALGATPLERGEVVALAQETLDGALGGAVSVGAGSKAETRLAWRALAQGDGPETHRDTKLHRPHARAWFSAKALQFPLQIRPLSEAVGRAVRPLREALRGVPVALWGLLNGVWDHHKGGERLLWVPGVWRGTEALWRGGSDSGLTMWAEILPWPLDNGRDE